MLECGYHTIIRQGCEVLLIVCEDCVDKLPLEQQIDIWVGILPGEK